MSLFDQPVGDTTPSLGELFNNSGGNLEPLNTTNVGINMPFAFPAAITVDMPFGERHKMV